jgi:hypothetical protein
MEGRGDGVATIAHDISLWFWLAQGSAYELANAAISSTFYRHACYPLTFF